MLDDLINIKITISGKRAVGKTMLIAKLKQIFEFLGANVVLEPENPHPMAQKAFEMSIEDNMIKKCIWDMWKITIKEETTDITLENIEKEMEEAYKRLENWNKTLEKEKQL